MASMPVLFLLSIMLFANEASAEKNDSNIIPLGSSLSPKDNHTSWASGSGLFAFGFYPQSHGFAVGIWLVSESEPENTIVWTANRDRVPVSSDSTLELTIHGRLLLRKREEDPEDLIPVFRSFSEDSDSKPVASACMHDSGNFVLYDKDFLVIGQSFDVPTDTILGGQNLTNELASSMSKSDHSSGHFNLSMQPYGYLVAYPVNNSGGQNDAYWRAQTYGSNLRQLSLSITGFLCLNDYRSEFQCLANSTNLRKKSQNTTSIYRATLDVDGNFRLYAHLFEGNTSSDVQLLWQALPDECQIKGYCGLNSYCSNTSGNAVCECYPGFVPSKNSSNTTMFLDCKQNYSKEDCGSNDDPTKSYNVTSLDDVLWDDYPYSVVSMKMETCEKSCREDCDCGAVSYASGNCKKYRLPLRYGRRSENSSGVAFFKVPSGNVISPNPTGLSQMKRQVVVDDKRSLIMILAFTLGSISLLCLVLAMSIFLTYRRQVNRYTTLCASTNLGFTEECSLRSFSFDELVKSTGGFTEEIGRGSFGAVYRGTIGDSNRSIAVKRLERIEEGEMEFRAEITAIARTHHRNLVQLIGFCIDGPRKLLVYEYLSNGSLANLLFKARRCLSWRERVKMALVVARGVLYLHEECEVRIIHCNIKPQNILMDEAWTAKISDFGLARLLKPEHSRTKREDEEKSGYLAPEWQKEASVSVKADIYSYGVVLLEIACRRRSIDINVSSEDEILLSSWVYQCFVSGQLNKLVADEDEDVDWKTLERMVKVGLWCVQDNPSLRPSIKNVILMLEGFKDIPIPPSPALLV